MAIDPGTVKGTMQVAGEPLALTHAYAHFHDNAEGVLSRAKELRILVTDREVAQSSLQGLVFLPIETMARDGEVVGLLLQLDPDQPNEVNVTLLLQPADPTLSLMSQTLSRTGSDLWQSFSFSPQRAAGSIEQIDEREWISEELPEISFTFTFSAPVFNEPDVTEDLKGDVAKKSPHAELVRKQVAAMKQGDVKALDSLASTRALANRNRYLEQSGMTVEQMTEMMKEFASQQEGMLDKIARVIVRGDRATLMFQPDDSGKTWANFVKEGGVWKTDD